MFGEDSLRPLSFARCAAVDVLGAGDRELVPFAHDAGGSGAAVGNEWLRNIDAQDGLGSIQEGGLDGDGSRSIVAATGAEAAGQGIQQREGGEAPGTGGKRD